MGAVNEPLYPHVEVKLIGEDGNAFAILGACRREARREKLPNEAIAKFMNEALNGDYDHLLQTVQKWFTVR